MSAEILLKKLFKDLVKDLDQDFVITTVLEHFGNVEVLDYIGRCEALEIMRDDALEFAAKVSEDEWSSKLS